MVSILKKNHENIVIVDLLPQEYPAALELIPEVTLVFPVCQKLH